MATVFVWYLQEVQRLFLNAVPSFPNCDGSHD